MKLPKCCRSQNTHDHVFLQDSPTQLEQPSLNIGIYLDEDSVTVGTIDTGNIPEVFLQIPAQITFLKDQVVAGGNAEKNQQELNYFKVNELIKEVPQPTPKILLDETEFTLSKEEVLLIFFQKLLSQIKSLKYVKSVNNTVLCSLLALTSIERERLKIALIAAGFNSVRILSSLLTTAVAHAGEVNFYTKSPERPKPLLVVQYNETSFFLSLVEITQDFIATKRCFSSANMKESQDGAFMQYHRSLFNNNALSPDRAHYVLKAYKKACRALCSENTLKKINVKILKTSRQNCFLDDILSSIFDDVQETFAKSGPLTGACILASKSSLGSVIPSSVIVCDSGFTSLILSYVLSNNKSKKLSMKTENFCPGVILNVRVPATIVKTTEILLKEEFLKRKLISVVGKYQLRIKNQTSSAVVIVRLKCLVDQDGILKIEPHENERDIILTRINDPAISSGEDSGVNKILSYYASLNDSAPDVVKPFVHPPDVAEETDLEDFQTESNSEAEIISFTNTQLAREEESEAEFKTAPEEHPQAQLSDSESDSEVTTISDSDETDEYSVEEYTGEVFTEINVEEDLKKANAAIRDEDADEGTEHAESGDDIAAEELPQIFESIRSYNFGTATLKNKTELWMVEAELLYDNSIKEFKPNEKSRSGVHRIHERLKVDAVDAFKLKFRKHGLELKQELIDDLETNLNDKFQKLIDGLANGIKPDIALPEKIGLTESSV